MMINLFTLFILYHFPGILLILDRPKAEDTENWEIMVKTGNWELW